MHLLFLPSHHIVKLNDCRIDHYIPRSQWFAENNAVQRSAARKRYVGLTMLESSPAEVYNDSIKGFAL